MAQLTEVIRRMASDHYQETGERPTVVSLTQKQYAKLLNEIAREGNEYYRNYNKKDGVDYFDDMRIRIIQPITNTLQ